MMRDRIWGSSLALVVVDPQRKFALKDPEWSEIRDRAVEGMNRYIRIFREHSAPTIFIHFDGQPHVPYEGADGDDWLQGIDFRDSDIVVHKGCMSCFKQTDLEEVLRGLGIDSILLIGMLTEYCVTSTYFSASERGISACLGKGALIEYNHDGNHAAEIICSTVTEDVVETFLDGKQKPWEGF